MTKTTKRSRKSVAPSAAAAAKPPTDARKVVLHIGWMSTYEGGLAAQFPPAEWRELRFDVDPRIKPDFTGSPEQLIGIDDGSVDVVFIPQMLQRFPLAAAPRILSEAQRVLKDEGRLMLSVPNAQIAAVYLANNLPFQTLYESKLGPITPMDLLYGLRSGIAQGERHFLHCSGFTYEQLGLLMRDQGFTNIVIQRKGYEITALGYKYPYGHPERAERIALGPPSEVETVQAAKPPAASPAVNSAPLKAPNKLPDDLDVPAGMWKPLGLKKTL